MHAQSAAVQLAYLSRATPGLAILATQQRNPGTAEVGLYRPDGCLSVTKSTASRH